MQHISDKAEGITVICLNYVQDKTQYVLDVLGRF